MCKIKVFLSSLPAEGDMSVQLYTAAAEPTDENKTNILCLSRSVRSRTSSNKRKHGTEKLQGFCVSFQKS